MAFARNVWRQIKNLTADDLINALERDGWEPDKSSGSFRPFIHPVTRKRVIIHWHPKKTYGAKFMQGLLDDIGWTEDDLKRLGLVAGDVAPVAEEVRPLFDIGHENMYGQLLADETDQLGNNGNVWIILCRHCGNRYGSDLGEFPERKCPICQAGASGIALIPV